MQQHKTYDIFSQLDKEVDDFNTKTINIAETATNGALRYGLERGNYAYNQKKVVNKIIMMYNSVFESGETDTEGQRKLYLNITRFLCDVFNKNITIDIKNFVFTPSDYGTASEWIVWLFQRYFKIWQRDSKYGETIYRMQEDFSQFGSCVAKEVKKDIERVPIKNILITQHAESINNAVMNGGFFTIAHKMTYDQLLKYPDWKQPKIRFDNEKIVYERYALVPKSFIEFTNTGKGTVIDEDRVICVAILMPEAGRSNNKTEDRILFIEELDKLPFKEAHSCKVDGRWLGIGQVEIQFENQIARNLTANLRRRALLWSSKKIYQSAGDGVAKNLIRNVKDGEVLQVGANGAITSVDTSNRALADFSQDDETWKENSQQKSFSFDVATGETMPSGTPFRLTALLSNSVSSYYDRQKKIFGMFLKDVYYDHIIPIFKKEAKDYLHIIASNEDGYSRLLKVMVEEQTHQYYYDLAFHPNRLNLQVPPPELVQQEIEKKLRVSPYVYISSQKDMYVNARYNIDLDITGDERDQADIESMTTLYTSMVQGQDPRAPKVLEQILLAKGKNFQTIVGDTSVTQPPQVPQQTQQINTQNIQNQQPQPQPVMQQK